jgi:hypothetical protein
MMDAKEYEECRSVVLDSISAICASTRGDHTRVAMMLYTYNDADELRELAGATIGLAGEIMHLAAHASGVSVDSLAGAVVARIREAQPQ